LREKWDLPVLEMKSRLFKPDRFSVAQRFNRCDNCPHLTEGFIP
jgi:hypothetical protein